MPLPLNGETIELSIDTGKRFQAVHGFGVSGAWWPNYIAEFPDDERDRLLRLLFTEAGAALSIYRCNLPSGEGEEIQAPLRRTVQVETESGKYNFDRDWKSRRILAEVRALGVENFVLFLNSPPPRLTKNAMVSGGPDGNSNLKPEAVEDFARYALDLAEYYQKTHDLPNVALSPINEPQWKWGKDWRGQEGCHYSPEEAARTVLAVTREKNRRGARISMEAPESGEWKGTRAYLEELFRHDELRQELVSVAVHSYWSTTEDRRAFADWFRKTYPEKSISMTEYCQMKRSHDPGMDGALHLAETMHEDLTIGGVDSWQWWLGIFTGDYNDALIYVNQKTRKVTVTKRLWVMGNYSRFIRPGAVRIHLEADGIPASAYIGQDGRSVTVVLTNNNNEAKAIGLSKIARETRLTGIYVTSDTLNLEKMEASSSGEFQLPPRSVATVTFVKDNR